MQQNARLTMDDQGASVGGRLYQPPDFGVVRVVVIVVVGSLAGVASTAAN